ncbi:MAG TPA: hypothetical protein GXZ44_07750 [Fermentimonas caenicola]|jgi:hypothetical protein|uniref:hypothetical protein n=1 Tax=Lascolabacillus TaxID=1924067 RepID=UPI00093C1D1F|nr:MULTISPECIES: hypothetical protein [Lascolabacillus]MBP6175266.1 hypothetical protein [Fermentimonas sp.]MDI9625146.1 hypothetical protein [Bacteroidota bacterium]HHU42179.1 hypothetical protein [Fermentimonas caenicola]MBP6196684.1 hypothetical protein [Fermentimonas sp.]MBP7105173.1 hypothetical protein [Fermentimonas sp.]
MNIKKKRFPLLIAFLTITTVILAQQVGSNSPYGRYGFGVLSNPALGASEAMGGISYGLRRSQQVNPGNPASYSELDSLTFIFDLGVSAQLSSMSDGVNSRDFYNGNLDYIALQFPLFRNMGGSVGLLPYSKVGYNFGNRRSLSDIQYLETYRGTGGLSQVYFGAAWEPFKSLSIGANVSYLFGNFSHSRISTPVTSNALISEGKNRFSIRELKYDLGLQYSYNISNTKSITFGAVYSPQITTKADVYSSVMNYTSDPYQSPDLEPVQIISSDTLSGEGFQIPQTFGAGLTYQTENFLVGVDGTYQLWKNSAYSSQLDGLTDNNRYNDLYRINAGAEYVIDPYSQNFFNRIRFRGGISYSNSYINVSVSNPESSQNIGMGSFNEYGINIGLGLPFHDLRTGHLSMLNIGFGYSRQDPNSQFMVGQDMFKISVNMNVNELWFFKRQFE